MQRRQDCKETWLALGGKKLRQVFADTLVPWETDGCFLVPVPARSAEGILPWESVVVRIFGLALSHMVLGLAVADSYNGGGHFGPHKLNSG